MNDIRNALRIAARRLELNSFLLRFHRIAIAAAALALLLMVIERVGSRAFIGWTLVVPLLAGAVLVLAFLAWRRRRRSELQVAVVVDERLDLREKFSTALHCQRREDPFAQAAVEDAVNTARDKRVRETLPRRFPVRAPAGWWMSPLFVLLALVLSLLEPMDLFRGNGDGAGDDAVADARRQAGDTVQAVVAKIENSPELNENLEELLGELSDTGFDLEGLSRPEQIKREALKKVSEINKRLEEILGGDEGKTMEALQRAMKQLDPPQDGPAKEFAQALARGDFKGAKAALEELQKKLENGELDDAQKDKLKEQLGDLAKQLEGLAQQQGQLEKALQQAGLDPKLAQDAQALQQALQNNKNLNEEQKQQLQQMMQAQQAACKMCNGLGQAAQQMAQAMQQGQLGEGMQNAGQQLDQMEQLQMLLQQAQAAANQCQGQGQKLGQGLGMQPKNGPGMGDWGQGSGGNAPIAPTPWGRRIIKADGVTNPEGDIIARMLIDGPQYVGESRKTASQVVAEVVEGLDEAQLEERVPTRYQEANLHYFGELQRLTEAKDSGVGGEEEAPAEAEPAEGEPAEAEPADEDAGS